MRSKIEVTILTLVSMMLFFSSSTFATRYYYSNGFRPYVCYESKTVYNTPRFIDVNYYGCFKSARPCYYFGARHFGKYSSYKAANRAYARCVNSTPKYFDY